MWARKAADQNCMGTNIFDFYPWCICIFNHSASEFYHNALHAHFFCWHFFALGLLRRSHPQCEHSYCIYECIVGKQSKENVVFILKVTTMMMMMMMIIMMNDDTVISDQSWCTTKWSLKGVVRLLEKSRK